MEVVVWLDLLDMAVVLLDGLGIVQMAPKEMEAIFDFNKVL